MGSDNEFCCEYDREDELEGCFWEDELEGCFWADHVTISKMRGIRGVESHVLTMNIYTITDHEHLVDINRDIPLITPPLFHYFKALYL